MSGNPFSAMMGGSECSTASNPLHGLLKTQNQDHSLHSQQYAPGPSGLAQGSSMRSFTPTHQGAVPAEEADRFFQQQHHGAGPGPINLDSMRRELDHVSRGQGGAIKGDRGTFSSLNSLRRMLTYSALPLLLRRVGISVPACRFLPLSKRHGEDGGAVPHAAAAGETE